MNLQEARSGAKRERSVRNVDQNAFRLIASRHEQASITVTSNLPFGRWGETFSDDVVAAAMIDRLIHHAEVLTVAGDSYCTRAPLRTPHQGPRQQLDRTQVVKILRGAISLGDLLPAMKELMRRCSVPAGTAQRAVALLSENGEAVVSHGRRAVVI